MNYIDFLILLAKLQQWYGRGVRVIDIQNSHEIPRQTIYYYLNNLIKQGHVVKVKRGYYKVHRSDGMIELAFCAVTPMDVYERYSVDGMLKMDGV